MAPPLPSVRVVYVSLLLFAHCAWAGGEHWAYQPIRPPAPPAVADQSWPHGDLDRFVLARLESEGLHPSPPADSGTLLRRVSLDLTGLPPTREEAAAFLRDPSPSRYAELVERLLASPRFGERWAAWWLDAARYADTQGYEKDNLRTIWSYRDWVIQAFNEDLPFDRFTIEQLAGDLLPSPTARQLVATAFHRNTMTNTEGGVSAEEFRVKAVLDRVNTTAQVWLGTTLACAQCHDHPHDPFTQGDYFGLFAIFNNTEDANFDDDRPLLTLTPLSKPAKEGIETTVPILRELPPEHRRTSHVFHRGQWLAPREAVEPATPTALPPLPPGAARDRRGFAQWLVSPENPLTSRVIVSRLWAQLFGEGLMPGDDFGTEGGTPVHQDLLDHLAARFSREQGWSLKSLLREIVLSATYQQSSRVTAEGLARDPANRLFARASRFPLPAEMLRDQALSAAGLLSAKMYGGSVMPPQPEGVWQVVYNIQRWTPSRGEDLHRRSLYTFWRRTSPFPALALLGAPTRESCVTHRSRSTSPLAALALLNDETMAECARALGRRMEAEGGACADERLGFGYRLLLCQPPSETSLAALRGIYEQGGAFAAAGVLLNLSAAGTRE